MKIKILAFVLIVTLLSISITKISVVNSKNYKPKTLFYTLCDEVQIEGDFFESSSEKMDGYSITVLNTEIISTKDFIDQNNSYSNKMNGEYLYLVKVKFRNINNKYGNSAGIDIGQYILQHNSYINFVEREAFQLINNIETQKIALRENTEMEFTLPFHIVSDYIDVNKLNNKDTQLVVSLYPQKKVIQLRKWV
mgnify:CR=1 FL=1